jgi:hypothetical protein
MDGYSFSFSYRPSPCLRQSALFKLLQKALKLMESPSRWATVQKNWDKFCLVEVIGSCLSCNGMVRQA